MMRPELPFGFRIAGSCQNERRTVGWSAAFEAHCADDPRADNENECYLSAFQFGNDFRDLLAKTRSPKGFAGAVWSSWLWFDVDGPDLPSAREQSLRLYAEVMNRFEMSADSGLIFYSGSKGFHLGIPSSLWCPEPAGDLHHCFRLLAEKLAESCVDVTIDVSVYDRVRAFRAPNSRHPKTGRHKRRFEFDELIEIDAAAIPGVCSEPFGFHLPSTPLISPAAVEMWEQVVAEVRTKQERQRQSSDDGRIRLNRATLDFIREGAPSGDRHRALFAAAANLAEFGCSDALAYALLSESGLDSGLAPSEVKRQVECGLQHRSGGA